MDFALEDVHVLVTGASGGIGFETARLFCALGANVTAHYNTQLEPLKELLKIFPGKFQPEQADLKQETSVQAMFARISKGTFGPAQVVVVNHGIWPSGCVPVVDLTLDRWNHLISTNLTSSFLVCREYLRGLVNAEPKVKDKAAIVLIGSTSGKYGEAGYADYAASKSAMMYGLTLTLKNEIVKIAPRARVNCIAPGWVSTPMAETALRDFEAIYRSLATTPLKKIATPLEIANQVVVLSSSTMSGHVTGQILMVDGGMEGALLNKPEDL
ncbi:NAD-P-binding protein [Pisolithus croceorrhizus]|nr:NAD-P-binding protein [Pisolithus croceorrhizus]KAI6133781.1 NAD-P-binding protein [Pisolithus croceorrhizus]KAI6164046.1 NAD-P-binding protein [Pisolithus thermaeus]